MMTIPMIIFFNLPCAFFMSSPLVELVTSWNHVMMMRTVAILNPTNKNHWRYGAIFCLIESNVLASLYLLANCHCASVTLSIAVS